MTWFRVDDQFGDHPKVKLIPRRIRLEAIGLWTLCGNYSARHLTDGFVSKSVIEDYGGTPRLVSALVDCRPRPDEPGLWVPADGGYLFHDWQKYQRSRADVEAEREAARKRVRAFRDRRKGEDGDR